MASTGLVLDTAIRRIAAASRPAFPAARSMRTLTSRSPSLTDSKLLALAGGLRAVGSLLGQHHRCLAHRQAVTAGGLELSLKPPVRLLGEQDAVEALRRV